MQYIYAIAVLSTLGGALTILLLIANRFLANYGECTVTVNDEDPFSLEGGGKLLDALYEQKIFIPSACGGQGTCGYCKVAVKSGGGPVLPTELPYLEEGEIEDRIRLACQVKIREDIALEVKEEFLNVKEFRGTVTSTKMVTPDTRELIIKLIEPEEIEFHPGQYVQVLIPGSGETTYRAYSLASPPNSKNEIELLVRLVPGGLGSTYLHNVQPEEELSFTGPYGEYIMDPSPDTDLICVGGGCGMAPMRSLLRYVQEEIPGKRCWLFFGARTTEDIMYLEMFEELSEKMEDLRVHYALSEPERSPEWKGETGFIHESVEEHLGADGAREAFLCGPPLMIEATMKVLENKNIPQDRVFYDEF